MPITTDASAGTVIDAPSGQTLKFGSFIAAVVFSVGVGGVSAGETVNYICKSMSIERKYREIETQNEIGKPNKDAHIAQARKGTMTLQVPAATSVVPPAGSQVIVPEIGGFTGIALKITSEAQKYDQGNETDITFDVKEVLNP